MSQSARIGPIAESIPPHGYSIANRTIENSEFPVEYRLVLTRDEIYVPIALRKPEGKGPFPAVTMGSGEGRGGMQKIEQLTESLAEMQDRMIERGYVTVTVNYRNEVPSLYGQIRQVENLPDNVSGGSRMLKSGSTLDHEDLISILRYLQTLPYVKKDALGAIGSSHSGEMILKAASEFTFGAGICVEPAAHEYLSIETRQDAPREGTELQYNDIEAVKRHANKIEAMERIRRINMPILIFGRDTDHLQGVFKLAYEWMLEAGKQVTWYSFNHPEHGYVLMRRQEDGSYKPDEIQNKAFEILMSYLDEHLKPEK